MVEKRAKADVDYSAGMPESHCGICRYYSNESCEKVEGKINPSFWCELFERTAARDAKDDEPKVDGTIPEDRRDKFEWGLGDLDILDDSEASGELLIKPGDLDGDSPKGGDRQPYEDESGASKFG